MADSRLQRGSGTRGLKMRIAAVAGIAALAAATAAFAQSITYPAPSTGSTLPAATYTAEQATRGASAYGDQCAGCHGVDASGGFGPGWTTDAFRSHWFGQPVATFFDWMKMFMPLGNAGALPDATYVDLVAYAMQLNGIAPGDTPLPGTSEALAMVQFMAPAAP